MHTLKSSRFIKLFLQLLIFISGGLILIGALYLSSYVEKYPSSVTSFMETSDFQSKFLKYVERTAVYCRYRESGYTPTDSSLYTTPVLPPVLTDGTSGALTPSESVHVASQESLDYYNYLLNECETNFVYYVKNLNTGTIYCSPYLVTQAGSVDNVETYLNEQQNMSAYLKLNTQSKRFVTNVNRGYQYLNESNINWVINYLQNGLHSPSLIVTPTYQEEDDNYELDSSVKVTVKQADTQTEPTEYAYMLYAYVLDSFPFTGDEFSPMHSEFTNMRSRFDTWIYYTPAALLCFLLSLTLAISSAGHKRKIKGIYLTRFDRVYTEISIVLIGGLVFLIWTAYKYTNDFYSNFLNFWPELDLLIPYVLLYPVLSFGLFSLFRRLKSHSLILDSLLYRILYRIGNFLHRFILNRHLTVRAVLIVLVFCLIQAAAIYVRGSTALILLILDYLLLIVVLVKIAIDLNIVMTETRKISEGNINHKIPSVRLISPFRELGQYINNIQKGFSNAVEERLKSERLKTELITNVSHDIKTPLTSIINYVDLLNKQSLNNETAVGYLNILTEKSWRLKNLIDDLVEASKASSGTLTLHFERINVGELLKQAAGEFEDRFLQRRLEMILNLAEKPLYVMADGRSTYRIIENLFSNVTKYALSGTRVYIDMREDSGNVLISVKNISAAQLNITGDELMERFVRGDMSRNTEGSGLGLSIAKSLAQLQHGTFELTLDGDLFKVLFTLPLCDDLAYDADANLSSEPGPIWEDAEVTLPNGSSVLDMNLDSERTVSLKSDSGSSPALSQESVPEQLQPSEQASEQPQTPEIEPPSGTSQNDQTNP